MAPGAASATPAVAATAGQRPRPFFCEGSLPQGENVLEPVIIEAVRTLPIALQAESTDSRISDVRTCQAGERTDSTNTGCFTEHHFRPGMQLQQRCAHVGRLCCHCEAEATPSAALETLPGGVRSASQQEALHVPHFLPPACMTIRRSQHFPAQQPYMLMACVIKRAVRRSLSSNQWRQTTTKALP